MVSIVIPTLGRPSLHRLLESIARFVSGNIDVYICVDPQSGGLERVRAISNSFVLNHFAGPRLHVLESPGPGVNAARNFGASNSKSQILWFLDDDVEIISKTSFEALTENFSDPQLLAVGGGYRSTSGLSWSERGYNVLCSIWRCSAGHDDGLELLLGGTLAVRHSAWAQVGGFDERIEYGGSETGFGCRLLNLVQKSQPNFNRLRVDFDDRLDVFHNPGRRSWKEWSVVASRQGDRKNETAGFLPGFRVRMRRGLKAFRGQPFREQLAFLFFGAFFTSTLWLSRRIQPR